MNRPKTIFLDIDGTLLFHRESLSGILLKQPKLIDGTLEKLHEWDILGYKIILTTGRKESQRKFTENELSNLGIAYDQLIMGIGGGCRIIINDEKPNNKTTAIGLSIPRNKGIKDIIL